MSFLTPGAFFLAGLLPVIILMYLLKLRRKEHTVSSVYLWRRMVRDLEANAPWQRLKYNLLLLLQLLVLVALIIALARPFTWLEGTSGQSAILILDTSASMAASDVSPNRLEAAKDQAHRLVDSLPDEARVTVIASGAKALVLTTSNLDRRQIHQAIEEIRVGTAGSDLGVALQIASAIAARQPDTQIIVLSDGGVTLPARLAVKGSLRYWPIGLSSENQAISLFSVEMAPGSEKATAFAQVTNYGEKPAIRRLAIFADGVLVNAFDLTIAPGEQEATLVEDLPPTTQLVEAQLLPDPNPVDFLASDDHALSVLRKTEPAKVTLVSSGNLFLETALALLPNLQVTTARPEETHTFPDADLTIFDSYIPITATLPQGSLFFIAPPSSTAFFTITGVMQAPVPIPASDAEPLLEHISLDSVNILDAAQMVLPEWAHPVILASPPPSGTQASSVSERLTPLLFIGETGGQRVAVLAFDLRRSDLPLQIAFPILMANLTNWLAPGTGGDIPTQVLPGAALTFSVPPIMAGGQGEAHIWITRPDNSTAQLAPEAGRVSFADTSQLGLYRVNLSEDPNDAIAFAVNLLSPQESNLKPVETLAIANVASATVDNLPQRARREWWRAMALIALGFLMGEWLVYNRPALAYLSKSVKAGAERQVDKKRPAEKGGQRTSGEQRMSDRPNTVRVLKRRR